MFDQFVQACWSKYSNEQNEVEAIRNAFQKQKQVILQFIMSQINATNVAVCSWTVPFSDLWSYLILFSFDPIDPISCLLILAYILLTDHLTHAYWSSAYWALLIFTQHYSCLLIIHNAYSPAYWYAVYK